MKNRRMRRVLGRPTLGPSKRRVMRAFTISPEADRLLRRRHRETKKAMSRIVDAALMAYLDG